MATADARAARRERQTLIRELIARNSIHSQFQLQALLEAEGGRSTQATLSRDLREIGAVKGEDGYRLERSAVESAPERRALRAALDGTVRSVDRGGNLVVLRTATEAAQRVAAALEAARLPGTMGTIVGGDTIFLATRTGAQAETAAAQLRRLGGVR